MIDPTIQAYLFYAIVLVGLAYIYGIYKGWWM